MFRFCVCLLVNECVTLLQSNILYKEASFSVFMRLGSPIQIEPYATMLNTRLFISVSFMVRSKQAES